MLCDIGSDLKCSKCSRKVSSRSVKATCRPGLGDMVASTLDAVGVTKDRVQAVASAVGISDCGCAKRQEFLNRVGRELLGVGKPPAD
jgi:hypothetical protein